MISLKTFSGVLAPMIGTTSSVLYERQRVLVRAGMLAAAAGRGPGSGVPTDERTVAMLLIAYASTDTLSEVEKRVPLVADANDDMEDSGNPIPCKLTGQTKFVDALSHILAFPDVAGRVYGIELQMNGPEVTLHFATGDETQDADGGDETRFSFGHEQYVMGSAVKGIQKIAIIDGRALRAIADTLQALRSTGALQSNLMQISQHEPKINPAESASA